MCEENDKFKNFFDNHFMVTNIEDDRVSKDELRDMFNHHTKCNYSASSIMTDIQRLQLRYEKALRTIYNGMSIRGVIVGIKKKSLEECDFVPEESSKKVKVHDLDFGLDMPCTQPIDDDISRKLKDKEAEVCDLHEQFEKMRLENEALKAELAELKRIMAEKEPEEEDIDAVKTAPQHRWSDDHQG